MKKTAAQLIFARTHQRTGVDPVKELVTFIKSAEKSAGESMKEFRATRTTVAQWMENNFTGRQDGNVSNIFNRSNQTMGIVRSHIAFITAKTRDDLFGTVPWYAVLPENPADTADTALTEQIYQHSFYKFREAGYEAMQNEAIDRCHNFGEMITRSGWRVSRERFARCATILAVPSANRSRTNSEQAPDEPEAADYPAEDAAEGSANPDGGQASSAAGAGNSANMMPVLTPEGDFVELDADGAMPMLMEALRLPDGTIVPMPSGADEAEAPGQADTAGEEAGEGGTIPTDASETIGAQVGTVPPMQPPTLPEGAQVVHVLQSDPRTVIPEGARAVEWVIEEDRVTYRGLDPVTIDWRNFRAAMDYARIEEAPMRGHFYECRLSDLIAKLEEFHGCSLDEFDGPTLAVLERAQAGDAKRKEETGAGSMGDEKNPVIKCFDCEVLWDPEGRGRVGTFFATVLWELDELFFVEYLAAMNPAGGSAYTVIPIRKPFNRWHGVGEWERFSDVMMTTDRLWNNLLVRDDMNANPFTVMHKDALDQDETEVDLIAGGRAFLKKDKKLSDFMEVFVMPNADGGTWKLVDYLLKLNELETGSTSPARGELAGQPSNATATGTQAILVSGSILHKDPENQVREGIEALLTKDIAFLYAMQDKEETIAYGSGETAALATITPEQVRGLKLKIRLTMTRFHNRELMQSAQTALGAYLQYLAVPETEKPQARILVTQILKGAGIQNADKVIRAALPPPSGPAVDDASERVNYNFKDLPPEAKVKALAKIGLDVPLEAVIAADAETSNVQSSEGRAA